MTNQEAIEILREKISPCVTGDWKEAVGVAISALQAQEVKHSTESSLTQKALDTISRKAAIEEALGYLKGDCFCDREDFENLINDLENLPSVQMETHEKRTETHAHDCINRKDAIRLAEQGQIQGFQWQFEQLAKLPSAQTERKNVIETPETGIGDLSDGYHTFNSLYEQRMILFATLVKAYQDKSWKSYRHEDGEYCFGGGWFIVGIDTPEGSYTYHYENKYWDMFDCIDLPRAKHWDGHTEADAETRLMSLEPERKKGKWIPQDHNESHGLVTTCVYYFPVCSECGGVGEFEDKFCKHCGADMRGE